MNTKLQLLFLLFFLMVSATVSGQRSPHKFQEVKVEDKGDFFSVEFRLPLHKKSVGNVESIFLLPMLEGEGHRHELPYIRLDGKGRCKAMKRVGGNDRYSNDLIGEAYITHEFPASIGQVVNYRIQIPYEEWIEQATLSVYEEIYGCAGKRQGVLHTLYRPETKKKENRRHTTPSVLCGSPSGTETPFGIRKCLFGFSPGTVGHSTLVPQ